tara:strand:+ start:716 stop:913 length:198 start_codon:yes stop_codon:yes gene_type:complete
MKLMVNDYLTAYQSSLDYKKKISHTNIAKVSYLLKLQAQCNSISDLDRKHKAWAKNNLIDDESFV